MPDDVPSLETQEHFGGFHEEIEKIVDGVLEDIKGGHIPSRTTARCNARDAASESIYATDLNYAVIAVVCGSERIKRTAMDLGRQSIETQVVALLSTKPEFDAMPEMSPEQVAEAQAIANRV